MPITRRHLILLLAFYLPGAVLASNFYAHVNGKGEIAPPADVRAHMIHICADAYPSLPPPGPTR